MANISDGEHRVLAVFPCQKPIGQWLPDDERDPFRQSPRKEFFSGVSPEIIIDDLNGGGLSHLHRQKALLRLMNGNSVIADFSLGFQFFQGLKKSSSFNQAKGWIMQLIKIDAVGAETL